MGKIISVLILLAGLNLQAQKKVEKEVHYEGQQLTVELNFASDIIVKTWDREAIKIIASVQTADPKYTERFELTVEESNSELQLGSNTQDLFESFKDEYGHEKNLNHEFNYTLYVPKNVQMNLKSITGNLDSEFLQGKINVDLVTGDIKIKKLQGSFDLHSVTGKIYLPVNDSSYSAKTVMGKIHGDKNVEIKKGFIGQEVVMNFDNSKNNLNLSTVTGDIYLNPKN